jgi:hypothetical protein
MSTNRPRIGAAVPCCGWAVGIGRSRDVALGGSVDVRGTAGRAWRTAI